MIAIIINKIKIINFQSNHCEKLLAEALQTTVVLEEAKEIVTVSETPKILEEEDDTFEEMSKQPRINVNDDDDDEDKFQEMTSVQNDMDEKEDEDEIFKIKEEEVDEEDQLLDATSPMTKSMDLLGNDIVKSIEKANILYEGDDLGNIFKGNNDLNSSEDDMEFKPVTSGKKKKRNKNNKNSNNHSEASSFADSESSEAMEAAMENKNEGWSFETDSNDIFKLLNMGQQSQTTTENNVKEEKAALEDVFKFDSELVTSEETATANNKPELKMSTSLNYEDEEKEEENKDVGGRENGLSQSLTSWATTTSTSESEVGNSPNPRATSKKKGKKKKKR